jgi:16S rRNA (cytosine967-C5)-methyltransferase
METARHLDPLLDRRLRSPHLKSLDRALITELVYGVLRQRAYLDWVISHFSSRARRQSAKLKNLLRLGAYQLLFLDRVPASAAVNESVRMARTFGGAAVAGFVNAALRAVTRAGAIPLPDSGRDPILHFSVKYSHPDWLVKRWLDRLGPERTAALCAANNEIPPVTVRVQSLRTTREVLQAELERQGILVSPCRVSDVGLNLRGVADLSRLSAYQRGDFYVQDEAAQLVGFAVDPKRGERILDACAAPGGKSTHLAELMGDCGEVTAADPDPSRLKRVIENARRLGLASIRPIVADLTRSGGALENRSYDRILVDAPCSGLGILRRNPEGKWNKTESTIVAMALLQAKILNRVAPLLKPGGVLVYSTCTTEAEENENLIDTFLAGHPGFRIAALHANFAGKPDLVTPEGYLQTVLNPYQMDHFFAAKLIKKSEGE